MDGAAQSSPSGSTPVISCDVLVIGGGPGGSATATFLARHGRSVVLVERERHPRFHVGESLLPQSLPLLDELGVLDAVREIGVHKPGAEFISADGTREAVFDFSRALNGGPPHAYQVRRSEFDALLFERARDEGVTIREETTAEVEALDDTGATIRLSGSGDMHETVQARFLVDASGRSSLMSKRLGEQRPDPRNTSAAIFGHFRGVPRRTDERAGNIRIHLTEPGWVWQIPLRDGVTSLGFVAPGEHLRNRDCGIEEFFRAHCARHPQLQAMLEEAEPIGRMQSTGNFSYRATAAAGPHHVKVGDAYGFLDPIFSTGVHLALMSAREAADAISEILANPGRRDALLRRYHRDNERRLSFVSWFVYAIHEPSFRQMMLYPRDVLGVERAMISLLAGDFTPSLGIRARIALFKLIRYMIRATGRAGVDTANG